MKPSLKVPNTGLNPLAAELLFAINQLQMARQVSGNLAEIGVAYGACALFLYQLKRPEGTLFLADIFGTAGENPSESFVNEQTEEHLRKTFLRLLNTDQNITFIKGLSQNLKPEHMSKVRLMHVDAGHS
ncbi:MAG: class I SAM-dependent methyltransferase, partial [Candidatus Xenobia bacterium]